MSSEIIRQAERLNAQAKDQQTQPEKNTQKNASFRNVWLTLAVLGGITVMALFSFSTVDIAWSQAITDTLSNLQTIFLQPALSNLTLGEAIVQILITFSIAVLTTVFSAIISVFLALFAARNIGGERVSKVINVFIATIRSIPTVLWVLIFAISAGLGSVAAVLGTSLHAIGYLVKMYSETFEEMDEGKMEALQATGASFWQIVFQAILPTTVRSLASWTFMRFEINYIVALGMGAAAGAGGIGFDLSMAGSFYYDMSEIGAITYLILVTCVLLEILSNWIQRRLKTN